MPDHKDQARLQNFSKAQPAPLQNGSGTALNDRLIAERISTLLSHFWTADDPPAIREAQLGDWIEDLQEFPASIVASACQEWRRGQIKRPLIADIRHLCVEMRPPARSSLSREAPMLSHVPVLPQTVRENWATLPFGELSAAEKRLFRADVSAKMHAHGYRSNFDLGGEIVAQ
jgi:hypothetical protein